MKIRVSALALVAVTLVASSCTWRFKEAPSIRVEKFVLADTGFTNAGYTSAEACSSIWSSLFGSDNGVVVPNRFEIAKKRQERDAKRAQEFKEASDAPGLGQYLGLLVQAKQQLEDYIELLDDTYGAPFKTKNDTAVRLALFKALERVNADYVTEPVIERTNTWFLFIPTGSCAKVRGVAVRTIGPK